MFCVAIFQNLSTQNIRPDVFLNLLGVWIDFTNGISNLVGCGLNYFGVFVALFMTQNRITKSAHGGNFGAEVEHFGVSEGLVFAVSVAAVLLRSSSNKCPSYFFKFGILGDLLVSTRG